MSKKDLFSPDDDDYGIDEEDTNEEDTDEENTDNYDADDEDVFENPGINDDANVDNDSFGDDGNDDDGKYVSNDEYDIDDEEYDALIGKKAKKKAVKPKRISQNSRAISDGFKVSLKSSFTTPLFVLVIYGLLAASRYIDKSVLTYNGSVYLSLVVLQFIVLIIPAIFFCRLKGMNYGSKLNLKLFSPGKLGFVAISAVVMISGSTLIRLAQVYITKRQNFSFFLYDSYVPGSTDSVFNVLYIAIAFAVLPAITEEFVFRGIVLTEYNYGGYGSFCAAFMSAAMFAMLHFSLGQLAIYFFGGLVLAFVVYTTQSLYPAMIAHMLYNLYGLFAESYIIKLLMRPSSKVFLIFAVVLAFLIAIMILLGIAERINFGYAVTGHPTPEYKLRKAEDGVTPDVSGSTDDNNPDAVVKKESFGEGFRLVLNAVFSPSFLLCVILFTLVAIGLI